MKRLADKPDKRRAFTIVELLTVMSVIILLISLLVPSLNKMKRFSLYVKQRNHFKGISEGLTMFNAEWQDYPDSDRGDHTDPHGGLPYCGAMKLCEAMVGQDVLGFHPQSRFFQVGTNDGTNPKPAPLSQPGGNDLYPARRPNPNPQVVAESESERKGLYISREQANAYKMGDLYHAGTGVFPPDLRVLCDVYGTAMHKQTGKTVGSPILYYKADTTKQGHTFGNPNNIYDYTDNIDLIGIGVAMQPDFYHPMGPLGRQTPIEGVIERPELFYEITLNEEVSVKSTEGKLIVPKPYNDDSFILISAGFDGLYGTNDDVFNFEK